MKFETIILILLFPILSFSQSRGPQPGEVFFSTPWYYTEYEEIDMIIYSANHGKNFRPIYTSRHYTEEVQIGGVYADAKEGCLYNVVDNKLYFSEDGGATWTLNHTGFYNGYYTTGTTEGEIYVVWPNYDSLRTELHRSTDFGQRFDLINDSVGYSGEVGTDPGEIYLRYLPWREDSYKILYSNNYGVSFNIEYPFDNSITEAGVIGDYYIKISRGTQKSELYLIAWYYPDQYKIFRSTNYGQNFELQYEQPDTANFFSEFYSFTAGRSEGEFYVFKDMPWFDGENTKLIVYYSNDYAKSFTKYEHIFDQEWTGIEDKNILTRENKLVCFPNPIKKSAEISYSIQKRGCIKIYDIQGKEVSFYNLQTGTGKKIFYSNNLRQGVYLIVLFEGKEIVGKQKVIIQ